MMKKILTVVFTLVLSLNMMAKEGAKENVIFDENAKTVLAGTVVDQQTGEVLVGVMVKIKGSTKSFYTDFDGNFEIKGLIAGDYEVELSLVSYMANHLKKVSVHAGNTNSLKVEMKQ
ncbi:MAG: carboxypeptidase-like regulatory domain-containing protein [Bacteroidota bacterium]|nr:carboxypeptidase-like regulatory domain-containing protein [Bacteroidota bacterium]